MVFKGGTFGKWLDWLRFLGQRPPGWDRGGFLRRDHVGMDMHVPLSPVPGSPHDLCLHSSTFNQMPRQWLTWSYTVEVQNENQTKNIQTESQKKCASFRSSRYFHYNEEKIKNFQVKGKCILITLIDITQFPLMLIHLMDHGFWTLF